ncbi:thiol:disulfide interchange protein DsbA/DsbL [Rodentibacter heidelbergensis]|nr:thiol:disulfide interchange protein DsbA/DsbL [Rodentibacter heidelbergensis]
MTVWRGRWLSLLGIAQLSVATANPKDFSVQNQPHLPSADTIKFEDGRDYFSYREAIAQPVRADNKTLIQFFFDYDCRVCSSAQDILALYSQIRADKILLEEYPVATVDNPFSAKVFYTLKALNANELSDALLFETSEKSRYVELSSLPNILNWVEEKGLDKTGFMEAQHSAEVKKQVQQAIQLTEEYGVFTYPYVVVGGKYVLTASTLYNDDYSVAVLDYLVNKLEKEQRK